jgi:hypothetical protein
MTMKPLRPITLDDLRGQPGLSRAASDALVAQQPQTVMKALVMRGVGRKTTQRLLALGLLTDPEGVQTRRMTLEELRATRREMEISKAKPSRAVTDAVLHCTVRLTNSREGGQGCRLRFQRQPLGAKRQRSARGIHEYP